MSLCDNSCSNSKKYMAIGLNFLEPNLFNCVKKSNFGGTTYLSIDFIIVNTEGGTFCGGCPLIIEESALLTAFLLTLINFVSSLPVLLFRFLITGMATTASLIVFSLSSGKTPNFLDPFSISSRSAKEAESSTSKTLRKMPFELSVS